MPRTENSINDFGLLIAYVLPGFAALYGLSFIMPEVEQWLGASGDDAPTLSGFLYGTVASVAAGLTVQTARWLAVDTLHHWTGLRPKRWDFSLLHEKLAAYDKLTENHYRFHQFYGGMVVALVWLIAARHLAAASLRPEGVDFGLFPLIVLFWLGSRDTLAKYYRRVDAVLATA